MSISDRQTISRIAHSAVQMSAVRRTAYLHEACAGNEALMRQVQAEISLLEDRVRDVTTVAPAAAMAPQDPHTAPIPSQFGRYRILRVLGEGGMGKVYLAEQELPRREVALKVIRPNIASAAILRRFEFETQALGRLQHPGIAAVHDAGLWTPPEGGPPQPYFAMEYVKGPTLSEFTAAQRLDTRQRLTLLAKICDAVQHAHSKGVIHRDLKPANILVAETPEGLQPKILDFGVARATDSDAFRTTLQADIGQLVGTVPYMSPEQTTGRPEELDTRSDVYALGVIGYELLAGRLPYLLDQKLVHEAIRIIREEEPSRLSTISRVYRGDAETIIARALEKDRARRYQTAADLAADIRRFLNNEPIVARPASFTYQLGKLARRHKPVFIGAAAAVLALVGGIAATSLALKRALSAEHAARIQTETARAAQLLAQQEARTAEAINHFLNTDLLQAVDPSRTSNREVTMREVLDAAAQKIDRKFADQPLVEAAVRKSLGQVYYGLGKPDLAEPFLRRALELYETNSGPSDRNTLKARSDLSTLVNGLGRGEESLALAQQVLADRRTALGDTHQDTLGSMNNVAVLLSNAGKHDQAIALYEQALAGRRVSLGESHRDTIETMNNLAVERYRTGRLDEASAGFEEVYTRSTEALGALDPITLDVLQWRIAIQQDRKNYPEADRLMTQFVEGRRRVLGDDHPKTILALNNHGQLRKRMGDLDSADKLFTEAVERGRRVYAPTNENRWLWIFNLGGLRMDQKRLEEAEVLLREAADGADANLSQSSEWPGHLRAKLGLCLSLQGRHDDAEQAVKAGYERLAKAKGAEHRRTKTAAAAVAIVLEAAGKTDEAAAWKARASDATN